MWPEVLLVPKQKNKTLQSFKEFGFWREARIPVDHCSLPSVCRSLFERNVVMPIILNFKIYKPKINFCSIVRRSAKACQNPIFQN